MGRMGLMSWCAVLGRTRQLGTLRLLVLSLVSLCGVSLDPREEVRGLTDTLRQSCDRGFCLGVSSRSACSTTISVFFHQAATFCVPTLKDSNKVWALIVWHHSACYFLDASGFLELRAFVEVEFHAGVFGS